MAKTLAGSGGVATDLAVGATEYFVLSCAQNVASSTSESANFVTYYENVTIRNLRLRVSANTLTLADTVVTLRKNGADTAATFTIPAGATGTFEDVINEVAFTSGDYSSVSMTVGGSGAGDITYTAGNAEIEKASGVTQFLGWRGLMSYTPAATAWFSAFGGTPTVSALSDVITAITARGDGELRNFTINVSANTRTDTVNLRVRNNNANGNGLITVTTGATGTFSDVVNVDTYTTSDTFNFTTVGSAGSGTLTVNLVNIEYVPTSTLISPLVCNSNASTPAAFTAAERYLPIIGTPPVTAITEANSVIEAKFDYTLSNLTIRVQSNATATDRTLASRINGADGNLSITIPSSTTGDFSDLVNSDAIVAGDEVCYGLTSSATGTFRIQRVVAWQTVTDPAPPSGGGVVQLLRTRLNLGLGLGLVRY